MRIYILLLILPYSIFAQLDLTLPEISEEDVIYIPDRKFLQFVKIKKNHQKHK